MLEVLLLEMLDDELLDKLDGLEVLLLELELDELLLDDDSSAGT